jgi:putative oxidoreductase
MIGTSIRWLDVAARIMIAVLFLKSGYGKLMDPGSIATRLADVGFPLATIAAYLTIAIEIGASIALIAGYRILVTCALLGGFTLLASVFFHQFWAVEQAQQTGQLIQFMKNMAIIGGLWFVARGALEMRTGVHTSTLIREST